jgi:AraC-like DNA-binding protein
MTLGRVLTFDDPYDYQKAFQARDAEILPRAKGTFRAELTQIKFDRLWMQRGEESLAKLSRGPIRKDRVVVGFSLSLDRPNYRVNGVDVSAGELAIQSTDELHNLSFEPYRWGSMSLTPTDFAALSRAIVGRELTRPLVRYAVRPPAALMSHFLSLHTSAARLAKSAPDTLSFPEVSKSLEDALIHALIRSLTEGTVRMATANEQSHTSVVAKLEGYVAANSEKPIYVGELCAALGISESTLRRCCHEHLGMGANRYLLLRRMHLARGALLRADEASTSVTKIAMNYGFWELGRFSVAYRSLFGEPPSVTLGRAPRGRLMRDRPLDLPMTDFA